MNSRYYISNEQRLKVDYKEIPLLTIFCNVNIILVDRFKKQFSKEEKSSLDKAIGFETNETHADLPMEVCVPYIL